MNNNEQEIDELKLNVIKLCGDKGTYICSCCGKDNGNNFNYTIAEKNMFCYSVACNMIRRHILTFPDYLNDLNAMHEAEKILRTGKEMNRPVSERAIYENVLREIASLDKKHIWEATACHRAKALVRTMAKTRRCVHKDSGSKKQ